MRRARAARLDVDVFLLPAVVGTGLGDIADVLTAAHALVRGGANALLYRTAGTSLPPGVDGPWEWPPHRRVRALAPRGRRAVTLSAEFGVTGAPARPEPYGRAGVWANEVAEIERSYGNERTLHLSIEEFARTLTSAQQVEERYREGGRSAAERARLRGSVGRHREVEEFHSLYRKFRAFARPNLLTIYPTFQPSFGFAREFPEAVQAGPLRPVDSRRRTRRGPRRRGVQVLWYASPRSSERIVEPVVSGLSRLGRPVLLSVRGPLARPPIAPASVTFRPIDPASPSEWASEWSRADLAIVTGNRSLMEARARRVPFLYFNGILGVGPRARRHRPEKLDGYLRLLQIAGASAARVRALRNFAGGRRVAETVRETVRHLAEAVDPTPWSAGFSPPFEETGALLVDVARRFGRTTLPASEFAAEVRAEGHQARIWRV